MLGCWHICAEYQIFRKQTLFYKTVRQKTLAIQRNMKCVIPVSRAFYTKHTTCLPFLVLNFMINSHGSWGYESVPGALRVVHVISRTHIPNSHPELTKQAMRHSHVYPTKRHQYMTARCKTYDAVMLRLPWIPTQKLHNILPTNLRRAASLLHVLLLSNAFLC